MIGLLLWILAAASAPPPDPVQPPTPSAQVTPRDWKAEFEEVCGKTQEAMQLSDDDLEVLIKRCDDLKAQIDKRPESERKVYLKRLAGCRNLFAYVLETRRRK